MLNLCWTIWWNYGIRKSGTMSLLNTKWVFNFRGFSKLTLAVRVATNRWWSTRWYSWALMANVDPVATLLIYPGYHFDALRIAAHTLKMWRYGDPRFSRTMVCSPGSKATEFLISQGYPNSWFHKATRLQAYSNSWFLKHLCVGEELLATEIYINVEGLLYSRFKWDHRDSHEDT